MFWAREEVSDSSPDLRVQYVTFSGLNNRTDDGIYVKFFMCHAAYPSVYMCCRQGNSSHGQVLFLSETVPAPPQ